ncbi:MAG: GNAT family N-acetyltransferase [Gemmatimonadota bacterium]
MPATEILQQADRLVALIPEWDALALRDPGTSPYDSGTLMLGLGDLTPCPGTPYVVTARETDGRLVGVLPLRRSPASGRLGGSRLTGYTTWHTSYFDAALDPAAPGAGRALLECVQQRRDWDRCDFSFLRADGNLLPLCRGVGTGYSSTIGSSRRVLPGAATSSEADRPVMLRGTARRLKKLGPVQFYPAVPESELKATLRRFEALHTARWRSFGEAAEFAAPDNFRRLEDAVLATARTGWARVGTLALADEVIAVHIAFRWRNTQYSWRMAHDARWQAQSPGRLLLSLMIEDAFASGCTQYDLGRGDEQYKELWSSEPHPLTRFSFHGKTWRGRLARLRTTG